MYRISELAQKAGLARSTLLYYEKQGLISAGRLSNGYRSFSDKDFQKLKLLQQLQAGGLSLKECQACLEAKVDRQLLLSRLTKLDEEIATKQQSRELLASMLGMSEMKSWHKTLEQSAPEAHFEWLLKQGFNEKEALRLRWLSKDMNEHEQYMLDFELIFEGLERLGPGSATDTGRAIRLLPSQPQNLLEIGCGRGAATILLANSTEAKITALDNEELNLNYLMERARKSQVDNKITASCASMINPPFETETFDVIWSEGSAYIMGFRNALKVWKPFIKDKGTIVISDLVWLTNSPSKEASSFWQENYPDMKSIEERKTDILDMGYHIVDSFQLSSEAWGNYLHPLRKKNEQVFKQFGSSMALASLQRELTIHDNYLGEYGYQMFVMQKE